MASSLEIKYEMAAFDKKDRNYYDNFTDEDRKKFSTYLMLRYGASVAGGFDIQSYYLLSTNEKLNKYFFDLNKHPKLQWLLCTTVSPGIGVQHHTWLGAKKAEGASSKIKKFLSSVYPHLKSDEIDLLASLNDKRNIEDLARELGFDSKYIKKEL